MAGKLIVLTVLFAFFPPAFLATQECNGGDCVNEAEVSVSLLQTQLNVNAHTQPMAKADATKEKVLAQKEVLKKRFMITANKLLGSIKKLPQEKAASARKTIAAVVAKKAKLFKRLARKAQLFKEQKAKMITALLKSKSANTERKKALMKILTSRRKNGGKNSTKGKKHDVHVTQDDIHEFADFILGEPAALPAFHDMCEVGDAISKHSNIDSNDPSLKAMTPEIQGILHHLETPGEYLSEDNMAEFEFCMGHLENAVSMGHDTFIMPPMPFLQEMATSMKDVRDWEQEMATTWDDHPDGHHMDQHAMDFPEDHMDLMYDLGPSMDLRNPTDTMAGFLTAECHEVFPDDFSLEYMRPEFESPDYFGTGMPKGPMAGNAHDAKIPHDGISASDFAAAHHDLGGDFGDAIAAMNDIDQDGYITREEHAQGYQMSMHKPVTLPVAAAAPPV